MPALIWYLLSKKFREFIERVGVRGVLVVHLVRYVGIYFIYLYSLNRLPYDFAVTGWCGGYCSCRICFDYTINVPGLLKRKNLILIWNILGLIDIIFVVITAGRINMSNPGELYELTVLPLSLLPTFIVPLIISTHIFMFHLVKKGTEK